MSREMLRHTVATLAYRGAKAVREAPVEFAEFRAQPGSRTPGQVLAHIGDLLDWTLAMAQGAKVWCDSDPLPWDQEVGRFFAALKKLDAYLASAEPLHTSSEKLFQGPIADALTHVGQLTYLRRLAGSPVRGENYFLAEITPGRVGSEQAVPRREFD
jgi:hypothetical protein